MTFLGIVVSKIYLNQIFAAREVLKSSCIIQSSLDYPWELFWDAWKIVTYSILIRWKAVHPASLQEVNFKINELDKTSLESLDVFFDKYATYKQKVSTGTIGKTAQSWMIYLDLMRAQKMTHTAVQENEWKSLMYFYKKQFLPMYFALNKWNYARYLFKYQSTELLILSF